MKMAVISLALATLGATPALAGEARLEVRSGLGWTDGQQADATLGAAAGYDVGAGPLFVGVEQSADKVLASGQKLRWGTSGRVGTHVTPDTKVYATAGYNYGVGPNATDIGGGVEHGFGPLYGKVEYKHFFNENAVRDSNAALVGVGIHF